LKSQIRDKLIQIANLFAIDCNISQKQIIDYYLVGANAHYNYTELSDIDVHIIIDFRTINGGDIDLADYYKDKKELFTDNHTITIEGYPVELYVQDVSQLSPKGQGIYSLTQNKFLIKPQQVEIDYNDPKLISKIESYIKKIDNTDSIEEMRKLKTKLKNMRTIGLTRVGEFSIENLTVKSLRNLGYIEKLQDKYKSLLDKALSI
jgi:predicted nucleotidyltransferase